MIVHVCRESSLGDGLYLPPDISSRFLYAILLVYYYIGDFVVDELDDSAATNTFIG